MKINTNLPSLSAQRNLTRADKASFLSLQRLSSGKRINSAADDAAGLAIAERMSARLSGTEMGMRNANDAISMTQTAEGALSEVGDMLQRMRELAVQSLNGTNSASDRRALQSEFSQLSSEIERIGETTEFNGQKLFDGSSKELSFQVGPNAEDTISVSGQAKLASMSESNIGSAEAAKNALSTIDAAIDDVVSRRVDYGAVQSRLESSISNSQNSAINIAESRSRIEDTDYAKESAELMRTTLLKKAGVAALAHANMSSQLALHLLGGVNA